MPEPPRYQKKCGVYPEVKGLKASILGPLEVQVERLQWLKTLVAQDPRTSFQGAKHQRFVTPMQPNWWAGAVLLSKALPKPRRNLSKVFSSMVRKTSFLPGPQRCVKQWPFKFFCFSLLFPPLRVLMSRQKTRRLRRSSFLVMTWFLIRG